METGNIFFAGDPLLLELDAQRPGPQEQTRANSDAELLQPLLEDVFDEEALATPVAQDALKEQLENARLCDETLAARQSAEFARKSIQNFVSELLRRAVDVLKDEAGFGWKEIRGGAYKAIGAGAVGLGGIALFKSGQALLGFVARHADILAAYAVRVFGNPALQDVIELIAKFFA